MIHSAGDTILGSDDKSGVAAIMQALKWIVEQNIPHRPIEVAFTIGEEVGLLGAKYLDYAQFQSHHAVVFDNEGDVGTIVNQAPGHMEIVATITGKAAHAGVAPEDGISAIIVAADAVTNMQLLRIDEETTANIGTFLAEDPNNIVPETVRISAEIRSHNPQKLQKHCNQMIEALENACRKYHAALQYTTEVSYASYHIPQNDPLILLLRTAVILWVFRYPSFPPEAEAMPISLTPTGSVRWWLEPAWKKSTACPNILRFKTWKTQQSLLWNL